MKLIIITQWSRLKFIENTKDNEDEDDDNMNSSVNHNESENNILTNDSSDDED